MSPAARDRTILRRTVSIGRGRTIAAVRGPPITVKCECGEVHDVPYGERWRCERCGRSWDTSQIPSSEYDGILREMRRFRISAVAAFLVIAAAFTVLALAVAQSFFLLMPVVMAGWYTWYMPMWRRKLRRRARSLPRWELTAEK
jgi:hypothetical protein